MKANMIDYIIKEKGVYWLVYTDLSTKILDKNEAINLIKVGVVCVDKDKQLEECNMIN